MSALPRSKCKNLIIPNQFRNDVQSGPKKEISDTASVRSIGLNQLDFSRKRMFLCIMLTFLSIHMVNMNVELIVPTYVAHNHATLNEVDVSFIMM